MIDNRNGSEITQRNEGSSCHVLNALKWGIFFTAKAGVEVFLDNFKNVGSIQLFKDIFTVF